MAQFLKYISPEPDDLSGKAGWTGLLDQEDGHPIQDCHLIVVGAGPSGLFCAINSYQKGKRIIILEKKNSPGHKLLISGSGQCNITHAGDIRDFLVHYGDHGRFLRPALLGFTNSDLVSYFAESGLGMVQEKGGKVFPESMRSRDVLNVLTAQCRELGLEIRCGEAAKSISRIGDGFLVICPGGRYRSRRLVIATGGCSYPATGSSGDGYAFARSLGHSISEIGPALSPVMIKDYPFSHLAGLSFSDLKISLYRRMKIKEHRGDILFTHDGLSGPGILDLSRYIRAEDMIRISFIPEERREELERWLVEKSQSDGGKRLASLLADLSRILPPGVLSLRLIKRLLQISGIALDLPISHLSREMRNRLIDNLTGLSLAVSEVCGFDQAMCTRGGVLTAEVNPKTMQSRLVQGLYLVGEVLDVDGDTGGYNLQAAFSTGMLAARSIRASYRGE